MSCVLVACSRDDTPRRAGTTTSTTVDAGAIDGEVVVVAGDLICSPAQAAQAAGSAAQCQSEATAALARALSPDAVLLAGDIQYERGRAAEFDAAYDTSGWAALASVTHPALGNHEYSTPGAAPYFETFGARAGDAPEGWYSFDIGGWHLVALNSNCRPVGGCGVGSPQERWLRADLARHEAECTLAFWHHPRWSSGYHGSDESLDPLWVALSDAGAEIVLSGHDHHYERFAPERGVRQFVVGTGGRSLYPTLGAARGSEVRNSNTFGVLELRLGKGEYGWRFHPVPGRSFTDAGRADCH